MNEQKDIEPVMSMFASKEKCLEARVEYFKKRAEIAEREGWQTIETAPKDGTHILVADFTKGSTGFGHCGESRVHQYFMDVAHWFDDGFYASSYGGGQSEPFLRLTHWMPLPNPPAKGERE